MGRFQSLANVDHLLACKLMSELWPLAAQQCYHDVCDSIDLWAVACKSGELTDYFKLVISKERDTERRECFEHLLLVHSHSKKEGN